MKYDDLMGLALAEAELAIPHGDVPVGALVVVDGEVSATQLCSSFAVFGRPR